MKQKPHPGSLQKAVFPCFLFNPMHGYDYCHQQFRIHRNSYLCHLILWQSVRLRGALVHPRKIFTALPILQKLGSFVSIRELQTNRFNHKKIRAMKR